MREKAGVSSGPRLLGAFPAGNDAEGVVKFRERRTPAPPPRGPHLASLLAWRDLLHRLGLVGQDPKRYGGAGFGNLSVRAPRGGFVITGTQTGHLPTLTLAHLVRIGSIDAKANAVVSRGRVGASSESLTHGAVYAAVPGARAVLHAHSPEIWRLRLPRTRTSVAYGTPAMAREVARLLRAKHVREVGAFAMGGHEDGIVTFGRTCDEAGLRMVGLLVRSLAPPE